MVAPLVVAMVVFLYVFCIHSTVKTATVFDVVRGDSVTGVANRLVKQNLIDSKDAFVALVRFNGGKIQSGQYDISKSASLWRIVRMMVSGDVATTTIVVPEGLTVKQIKELWKRLLIVRAWLARCLWSMPRRHPKNLAQVMC